ncbi:hypothetical protein ABS768_09665 [Flavobacterium sp. ST-75]|uniref:DUF1129 domain-containing protein n=1 Tax=Flavobacterium rhizophilum TaxID=3163296 RepID=A0ABW8YC14_9FLAO
MQVTENQIKFIDQYLENSGVKYLDIRYEMTDHVATVLEEKEGDFYDEFKTYMILYKKELLDSNNKFSKIAKNKAIKLLFGNLLSVKGLLIAGSLFGLSLLGLSHMNFEKIVYVFYLTYFVLILVISGFNIYHKRIKKEKLWSGTHKLMEVVSFIINGIMILGINTFKAPKETGGNFYFILYQCVIVSIIVMTIITSRQLMKKYKLRYEG